MPGGTPYRCTASFQAAYTSSTRALGVLLLPKGFTTRLEELTSRSLTSLLVRKGKAFQRSVAAPVTCGVAMLVPLIVLVAALLPFTQKVDRMLTPGAAILTTDP